MRCVAVVRYALVLCLSAASFAASASGQTNTPFAEGTQVSVTTEAGTVEGTLQTSSEKEWILLTEAASGQPAAVSADALIVRVASPAPSPKPTRGAPFAAPAGAAATASTTEHYLFGQPIATDDRHRFIPPGHSTEVDGITVLEREAFTLGHYDEMKVPAWVAMRWTEQSFEDSLGVNFDRDFQPDPDLPDYARGGKNFDFASSQMERGHMARDDDLEGFGRNATREGCLMSNIVPQRKGRNHVIWGDLEEEHQHVVAGPLDIDTVWIVSGPVFFDDQPMMTVGNGTGVPHATYKVIAWLDAGGAVHARGYIIEQNDTDRTLTRYLRTIDEVEDATGLDFLHELDDSIEGPLESQTHQHLWN